MMIMAVSDELTLLKSTKASIKQKLINKDLQPTEEFSTYPTLIDELSNQKIMTQAEYDGLETKNENTLYLIIEQPVIKYVKWEPTTNILSNDSYSSSLSGKESDSVKLLIKGYTSITITISYSVSGNQEDHYIKAYNLDSTSSVKGEINMDNGDSKTITYTIPDDGAEHSIYFSCYGGYYGAYTGTFHISYSRLV